MTQEKMRKVITACVSAATVLLVFLLGYLIYQWISLGVQKKKIDEIEKQIAILDEQLKNAESDEEYYMSNFYLKMELDKLQLIQGK